MPQTFENIAEYVLTVVHATRGNFFAERDPGGPLTPFPMKSFDERNHVLMDCFLGCRRSKSNSTAGIRMRGTTCSFTAGASRINA